MTAAPPLGIAFTASQLASFIAWSSHGRHRLRVVVERGDERLGVYRDGEDPEQPRWFVHRAPEGLIHVTRMGAGRGVGLAVTADEVQAMIEAQDAAERQAVTAEG